MRVDDIHGGVLCHAAMSRKAFFTCSRLQTMHLVWASMTITPKILAFAGSSREQSYNKKLVKIASDAARNAGATVTYIDLRDFSLPLYDGDLEEAQGLPENAIKLKELFNTHEGLLISSPEYNSSISAVLKNTIDWLSRPHAGEKPLGCFTDKVAGLMSASPGQLGGLRGLVTLRSILGNIQVHVHHHQIAISKAHEAFDEAGNLKNSDQHASVQKLASSIVRMISKLKA